jgi:tetratricopeptide (TPR) repeat protein
MRSIFLIIAHLIFLPLALTAQTGRAYNQANRWFKLSERQKNPAKKIEALKKAVAFDSLFVNAFFQLGKLYADQKDYPAAETSLNKAYSLLATPAQDALKAQVLYELALAREQLGKMPEAEAALREAKTIAGDRKMQAFLTLELGKRLYRQQRYPEACAEFLNEFSDPADSDQSAPEKIAGSELQALYARVRQHSDKGEYEKAIVAYDSLLQRTGAWLVAEQMIAAGNVANEAWPLSAALKPRQSRSAFVYICGAIAAVIILPVFGFVVFSSTSRIAFYRWRRNYAAAAGVFEKLLKRHPQKIQRYAPLAELYLRLGRNDERALKVYKTVLQLNLPTLKRDEINALVAQNYLNEGRMDADAIEVLEVALKSEMRKQSHLLPKGR